MTLEEQIAALPEMSDDSLEDALYATEARLDLTRRALQKTVDDCPANKAFGGVHEFRVLGTPRSAMTYYECRLCGLREERGPGLFYREPSAHKDIAP